MRREPTLRAHEAFVAIENFEEPSHVKLRLFSSPGPLHLAHNDVIVAPAALARCFSVRVSGHALRDLDTPAVRQIVRNPRGAEGVAAYRGFNPRIGSAAAHDVPDMIAQLANSCVWRLCDPLASVVAREF